MIKMINNPLPMYPYVNAWIAQVKSLKCNMKLACLLCYCVLCGLWLKVYYGLRGWLPQWVVDSHYVIMLTNVNIHSLYMNVTSSIGSWCLIKGIRICTCLYYYACKVYVSAKYVMYHSLGWLDRCISMGNGMGLCLCIAHVYLDRTVLV